MEVHNEPQVAYCFYFIFLLTANCLPIFGGQTAVAETGGTQISASTVNVRSGPGLSYSVAGSLAKGDKVDVIGQEGDWLKIQAGETTGWVASWLTSAATGNTAAQKAVSTVDRLNVRSQPSLSASVLTQMKAGDQAEVIRETGDWVEVEFRNTRGFVSKQYISATKTSSENPAPAAKDVSSFEIAVSTLNVRKKADLSSDKIATVHQGEIYAVQSLQGNWVQIRLSDDTTGWVYAFYGHLSDQSAKTAASAATETVTILTDGTNLRSEPSTASGVVSRANAGDQLGVIEKQGDWYKVALPGGQEAFIATWVVTNGETAAQQTSQKKEADRKAGTLNGVTIVLDPGHGGRDGGTVGVRGTIEKDLTLKTAEALSHYLRSAGAEVVMTRQSDVFVDLRQRVSHGYQAAADAFISIHYDAVADNRVQGFTTYFMHGYQQQLGESINAGLEGKLPLNNRGARSGNYLVLRENRQPAVLVELGYLSNFNEERIVSTSQFRDQAALGLYTGIINYFDAQLGQ
ncbi:SH3 domain-containing protein [Planomicrobium sp. CPCC 101110]|uniref:SH3 domain-containing protein n=1 Tax=Planomicrobium sp. CPCC 101110 TaxID=2599619 RepID=UPI0011B77732|nr:SH3 domain-containing protein [Planomicrobium sp. CPCC 101110]TWT26234.1 SH3 domain-containing protein [Planomicrobium sp. CPCC 101110]